MIYRDDDVINRMKELDPKTEVFKQALTESDLNMLRIIYEECTQDESLIQARTREGMSRKNTVYKIHQKYWNIITELIYSTTNLDRKCKFENLQFYRIQRAYHLHTDTGLSNIVSYRQGVIPLEVVPRVPTYTVIFNEKSYFSAELVHRLFKKPSDYKPFYNIPILEPRFFEGWTDEYRIPDEECQRFWKGEWEFYKEVYKGFSVDTVYEWNPGDILTFGRTRAHAATSLDAAGIDYKIGLLFLTYYE